jgi:predicted CXXCH cytochrome family protein
MKNNNENIFLLVLTFLFIVLGYNSGDAKITGNCANCHTMHTSQNGTSGGIAFGGSSLPQPALLRGDCIGCHGQGTPNKIVTIGGSQIPQVLHTDASGDLAGGNFAYITGAKGSGASDAKGHNVIELGNPDDVLNGPPGPIKQTAHETIVTDSNLTCAGENGCHGANRFAGSGSGLKAIKGAHHRNKDGKCDFTDTSGVPYVYNSYRFLCGVKGLENTASKWQDVGLTDHNEYFGVTTPPRLGCNGGEVSCHGSLCSTTSPPGSTYPSNGSISGFCGTCHGNFHGLTGGSGGGTSDGIGIGGSTTSPFRRHPTDITLYGRAGQGSEYAAYTTYSVEAPVARATVPDSPSSTVNPNADIVMCLSCHGAHGTNYPDILRWDYSTMVAGGGGSGGCFTCHTQKNQNP